MSWMRDVKLTSLQHFFVEVLKQGPVPNHVAFIMDGNRRFADKTHVKRKEGHNKGFEKLAECLQWCLELGVREVTVYAFSIENFKRSKEEVDNLMELAREKYKRLIEEKEKLLERGVCIRVIGNLSLLPDDIRKSVAEAMLMTKDNNKAFLNVAFAYTSSEEMTSGIRTLVEAVENKELHVDDITTDLLTKSMYSGHCSKPDILIRTSGEIRFSDFLLWQTFNTTVCFEDVLWPEFCIWHLLMTVFKYQRAFKNTQIIKQIPHAESPRVEEYIKNLDNRRIEQLQRYNDYVQ